MNIIKKTERVSFYSHFAGFLLAVAGTVYLMYTARHSILNLFVSTIYGASVILLFLASSLYHAFKKKTAIQSGGSWIILQSL